MGRVARKYPTGRFILRKSAKVDEEKLYPVYLCYYCNGKKIRQSTSIMAMTKDWNQDANHGIASRTVLLKPVPNASDASVLYVLRVKHYLALV